MIQESFIRCLGKIIGYHKHLRNSETIAELTLTALQTHTHTANNTTLKSSFAVW